jgi:hypothetical protein
MTTVNNASGIFATLNYNFDDPNGLVATLSDDAQKHLDSMPPFISSWQAQDIINNNVGGYYKNPLANDIILLRNAACNIGIGSITGSSGGVIIQAVKLANTANTFLEHTNRLSGITPYTGEDSVNPYLEIALNSGKVVLYVTNQTDSIKNTAPIMGSFTSILVGPQIKANAETINTYSYSTVTTEGQNETINTYLTGANTFMTVRMNSDITYYTNLKDFIDKYNQTKKFNKAGEVEIGLLMNVIGTDKLKSRIS